MSWPALLVSHWQQTWSVDALAALCAGVYLFGRRRVTDWSGWRTAAFLGGTACVVIALQSGLGAYDDRLLSAHMVQHLMLLELAPLLLLSGRPVLLALRAAPPASRPRLARALARVRPYTNPVVCLVVFYVVVLGTHLPSFYDASLSDGSLHVAEHAAYVAAGLLLWWPLLDADPAPRIRLSGLGRLIYVLAAMPPMAAIGVWLNRAPSVVYDAYAAPAHRLGVSAVIDQQQAGAIMWVAGGLIVVAVGLWASLGAMVAEERRLQAREARGLTP